MLFNTLTYFWFICIVFAAYWFILNKKRKLQNVFLLFASYCFYGWWDVRFLILIFVSSSADFLIGRAIWNANNQLTKKNLLLLCLFLNLGILGFFKYYNFLIRISLFSNRAQRKYNFFKLSNSLKRFFDNFQQLIVQNYNALTSFCLLNFVKLLNIIKLKPDAV